MENKELIERFYAFEICDLLDTLTTLKIRRDYLSNIMKNCKKAKDCKNCKLGWEDGSCTIVDSEGLEGEF